LILRGYSSDILHRIGIYGQEEWTVLPASALNINSFGNVPNRLGLDFLKALVPWRLKVSKPSTPRARFRQPKRVLFIALEYGFID
jgi:hypothetical protein